jgi:hypothetical protein
MPLCREKYILWFQVPVDDLKLRVQVFECQCHLRSDEPNYILRQSLRLLENLIELSTRDILHHEVETTLRLEGVLQLHDEWVLTLLEDVTLQHRIRFQFVFYDLLLLYLLHRIDLPIILLLHAVHLPKCSLHYGCISTTFPIMFRLMKSSRQRACFFTTLSLCSVCFTISTTGG